jgi:hypothetical protein
VVTVLEVDELESNEELEELFVELEELSVVLLELEELEEVLSALSEESFRLLVLLSELM